MDIIVIQYSSDTALSLIKISISPSTTYYEELWWSQTIALNNISTGNYGNILSRLLLKWSVWRYSLSLMKPLRGVAQPSDNTCTHCMSSCNDNHSNMSFTQTTIATPTLFMVIAGSDSASLRAASNLSDGMNNSMTCVVMDLGMILCVYKLLWLLSLQLLTNNLSVKLLVYKLKTLPIDDVTSLWGKVSQATTTVYVFCIVLDGNWWICKWINKYIRNWWICKWINKYIRNGKYVNELPYVGNFWQGKYWWMG